MFTYFQRSVVYEIKLSMWHPAKVLSLFQKTVKFLEDDFIMRAKYTFIDEKIISTRETRRMLVCSIKKIDPDKQN